MTHGFGAEFIVSHAPVQFVFDNPAFTLAAILDQLLSPGGVTCSFHEGAGSVECVDHCRVPFDCDCKDQQEISTERARRLE
ncbi:hypothetical protein D9M70_624400 [compost metagenome]